MQQEGRTLCYRLRDGKAEQEEGKDGVFKCLCFGATP